MQSGSQTHVFTAPPWQSALRGPSRDGQCSAQRQAHRVSTPETAAVIRNMILEWLIHNHEMPLLMFCPTWGRADQSKRGRKLWLPIPSCRLDKGDTMLSSKNLSGHKFFKGYVYEWGGAGQGQRPFPLKQVTSVTLRCIQWWSQWHIQKYTQYLATDGGSVWFWCLDGTLISSWAEGKREDWAKGPCAWVQGAATKRDPEGGWPYFIQGILVGLI